MIFNAWIARIGRVDLSLWRAGFIAFAMVLYGGFGSPTPDDASWAEVLIAALLMMGMGIGGAIGAIHLRENLPLWHGAGIAFLIYGLCAGGVGAIFSGAELRLVLRDVLPFLFLFLPLFMITVVRDAQRPDVVARVFLLGLCCVGALFSLRAVFLVFGADALYYLGNSPLVLFAAMFGFGMGVMRLSSGLSLRNIGIAGVFFALCGLCLVPLALALQRASLALFCFYAVFVFVAAVMHVPRRGALITLLCVPMIWAAMQSELMPLLVDLLSGLQDKTRLVGVNMRIEEWRAVWAAIGVSPMNVLSGKDGARCLARPLLRIFE